MKDLHKEIMDIINFYRSSYYHNTAIDSGDFFDIATDILKLVNDNYVPKDLYNNTFKEGKWR